jgi:hypothetical protein
LVKAEKRIPDEPEEQWDWLLAQEKRFVWSLWHSASARRFIRYVWLTTLKAHLACLAADQLAKARNADW